MLAAATPGRELGDHPSGGKMVVRAGKYGPYVNWGKVNATLPKSMTQEEITPEQAIELVNAKAAAGGGAKTKTKASAKPAAAKAPAKASKPPGPALPTAGPVAPERRQRTTRLPGDGRPARTGLRQRPRYRDRRGSAPRG